MIIEGDFTIDAPIQQVWDFLIDIERMSLCLPGVEQVEQTGEKTYSGVVTIKVGPISTSFQGEVNILEEDPPNRLRAKLQGRDRKTASMVTGEFSSEITALDEEVSQVDYKFDIKIRGRLGQFGQAVILDTSKQLTNAFVECVRTRVENPEEPAEAKAPDANVATIALRAFLANLWRGVRDTFHANNG
jgi:carbon monoxide dehydrogenase subunit G